MYRKAQAAWASERLPNHQPGILKNLYYFIAFSFIVKALNHDGVRIASHAGQLVICLTVCRYFEISGQST